MFWPFSPHWSKIQIFCTQTTISQLRTGPESPIKAPWNAQILLFHVILIHSRLYGATPGIPLVVTSLGDISVTVTKFCHWVTSFITPSDKFEVFLAFFFKISFKNDFLAEKASYDFHVTLWVATDCFTDFNKRQICFWVYLKNLTFWTDFELFETFLWYF